MPTKESGIRPSTSGPLSRAPPTRGDRLPSAVVGEERSSSRRSGARSSGPTVSRSVGSGLSTPRRRLRRSRLARRRGGAAGAPTLLVLHGLEGSSRSHYVSGSSGPAGRAGWTGRRVQLPVVQRRAEPAPALLSLRRDGRSRLGGRVARGAGPGAPIGAVGVSLGGNVLLKWLGRWARRPTRSSGGGRDLGPVRRGRLARACSTADSTDSSMPPTS